MKIVSAIALTAALLVSTCLPSAEAAEPTPEQVHRLLDVMNAGEMGVQMMTTMINQFQMMMPEVPAEYWEEFLARVQAEDLNGIVAPIYQRHFTEDEVVAMTDFYESPIGQVVLSKMPVVLEESMAAGQVWGEQLVNDLIEDLLEKGYEVPGASES